MFYPKFSRDSYQEFQKKLFRENFSEILCKQRFTEICEISPYFLQFFFWVRIALKKILTSTFTCCLHPGKETRRLTYHKNKIGVEKQGGCVFGKPVLFTLGLGLTTPRSLGILVWNIYHTFFILSILFWLRFDPQIYPTRFAINFLFITIRTNTKVRLCVKLFEFFRRWILVRLTWNLSYFIPNSIEIFTWNFWKKLFWENFSEILCKPRLSSTKTCKTSPYFMQFFSGFVLRWKKSHKYFHMLFAPR